MSPKPGKFERTLSEALQARSQQMADLNRALDELNRVLDTEAGSAPATPTDVSGAGNGSQQLALVPAALAPPGQSPELDSESLKLLTRFLGGAVVIGLDELFGRLRTFQAQMPPEEVLLSAQAPLSEATPQDLARYFALGTLAWGRRQAVKAAYAGLDTSTKTAGSLARMADRLTDNWLLQPVRRPIANLAVQLQQEARLRVEEGWREDQISQWLAEQTINDIIEDSIDRISESPQLAVLVRDQMAAQSLGLAGTVADNGRQISSAADNLLEGVVRKLLRRKPRRELPPSPLAGVPQTMYETIDVVVPDDDDR